MAEIIMTFALGFLIAAGIALALAAPLWKRAAAITRKRIRASSPVSIDDFNAASDRMRAEFALSTRKLEMSVESLRRKAQTRLAELDRQERRVAALKESLEEKAAQIATRDEEIADLKDELADAKALLERSEREIAELRERASASDTLAARKSLALRQSSSLYEDWEEPAEESSSEDTGEGSGEDLELVSETDAAEPESEPQKRAAPAHD